MLTTKPKRKGVVYFWIKSLLLNKYHLRRVPVTVEGSIRSSISVQKVLGRKLALISMETPQYVGQIT